MGNIRGTEMFYGFYILEEKSGNVRAIAKQTLQSSQ